MEQINRERKAQIVYFSHGGGPLPILGDPGHKAMVEFMNALPNQLEKPDAILVISAHWEENEATLLGEKILPCFTIIMDFLKKLMKSPTPLREVLNWQMKSLNLLNKAGIPSRIDSQRGFDHGLFIPLKLMYPQADIPSIQLSLIRGLDARMHIALGNALRGLLGQNILVIGSGFSFHNLQAFFQQSSGAPDPANEAFQDWLIETCTGSLTQPEREQKLIEWEQAPFARYNHPREEHLLPLHVCQEWQIHQPN